MSYPCFPAAPDILKTSIQTTRIDGTWSNVLYPRAFIEVEVFGQGFPTRSSSLEMYRPQHQLYHTDPVARLFCDAFISQSGIEHKDIIMTWKGLSIHQARELYFWEHVFKQSLQSHIESVLWAGFLTSNKNIQTDPRTCVLSHLYDYIIMQRFQQLEVDFNDLITRMISQYMVNGKHFDWFATSGSLRTALANFLQSRNCFVDTHPPHPIIGVYLSASPSQNSQPLKVFAEVAWIPPRIIFPEDSCNATLGDTYYLKPRFIRPSIEENVHELYTSEIQHTVNSNSPALVWDSANQAFCGTATLTQNTQPFPISKSHSPLGDPCSKIGLETTLITHYPRNVRLEQIMRTTITLTISRTSNSSPVDHSQLLHHMVTRKHHSSNPDYAICDYNLPFRVRLPPGSSSWEMTKDHQIIPRADKLQDTTFSENLKVDSVSSREEKESNYLKPKRLRPSSISILRHNPEKWPQFTFSPDLPWSRRNYRETDSHSNSTWSPEESSLDRSDSSSVSCNKRCGKWRQASCISQNRSWSDSSNSGQMKSSFHSYIRLGENSVLLKRDRDFSDLSQLSTHISSSSVAVGQIDATAYAVKSTNGVFESNLERKRPVNNHNILEHSLLNLHGNTRAVEASRDMKNMNSHCSLGKEAIVCPQKELVETIHVPISPLPSNGKHERCSINVQVQDKNRMSKENEVLSNTALSTNKANNDDLSSDSFRKWDDLLEKGVQEMVKKMRAKRTFSSMNGKCLDFLDTEPKESPPTENKKHNYRCLSRFDTWHDDWFIPTDHTTLPKPRSPGTDECSLSYGICSCEESKCLKEIEEESSEAPLLMNNSASEIPDESDSSIPNYPDFVSRIIPWIHSPSSMNKPQKSTSEQVEEKQREIQNNYDGFLLEKVESKSPQKTSKISEEEEFEACFWNNESEEEQFQCSSSSLMGD